MGPKRCKRTRNGQKPPKSVSCWKHFGTMLVKRWEVARERGFERIFYAREPATGALPHGKRFARNDKETRMAKHIFVTGGVVSSLGKGITAASLGSF